MKFPEDYVGKYAFHEGVLLYIYEIYVTASAIEVVTNRDGEDQTYTYVDREAAIKSFGIVDQMDLTDFVTELRSVSELCSNDLDFSIKHALEAVVEHVGRHDGVVIASPLSRKLSPFLVGVDRLILRYFRFSLSPQFPSNCYIRWKMEKICEIRARISAEAPVQPESPEQFIGRIFIQQGEPYIATSVGYVSSRKGRITMRYSPVAIVDGELTFLDHLPSAMLNARSLWDKIFSKEDTDAFISATEKFLFAPDLEGFRSVIGTAIGEALHQKSSFVVGLYSKLPSFHVLENVQIWPIDKTESIKMILPTHVTATELCRISDRGISKSIIDAVNMDLLNRRTNRFISESDIDIQFMKTKLKDPTDWSPSIPLETFLGFKSEDGRHQVRALNFYRKLSPKEERILHISIPVDKDDKTGIKAFREGIAALRTFVARCPEYNDGEFFFGYRGSPVIGINRILITDLEQKI